MAAFAARAAAFEAAGAGLAAISGDRAAALARFRAERGMPFPLLSDPECQVIRQWGLYNPAHGGIARPAVLWVGADRRVRYAAAESMAARVGAAELLALVAGRHGGAPPRPRRCWPRLADWARALRSTRAGC